MTSLWRLTATKAKKKTKTKTQVETETERSFPWNPMNSQQQMSRKTSGARVAAGPMKQMIPTTSHRQTVEAGTD
jgi:hypothetical protein